MPTSVLQSSRLQFGDLLSYRGTEVWDTLDLPDIPVQTDDLQYMVQSADRIDRLAYRFYGDPILWWVIAAANDMEILPTDLYSGQILRIPSPGYVLQQLLPKGSTR